MHPLSMLARAPAQVPILFLHGVGVGLLPYIGFIAQLATTGQPVIALECNHLGMRWVARIPDADEVVAAAAGVLRKHDVPRVAVAVSLAAVELGSCGCVGRGARVEAGSTGKSSQLPVVSCLVRSWSSPCSGARACLIPGGLCPARLKLCTPLGSACNAVPPWTSADGWLQSHFQALLTARSLVWACRGLEPI